MTLVFRVIYAAHCSGTHHKIAMDSLLHLKGDYKDRWQDLFLKHARKFIEGSKAPDKEFKDFSNHVLHVQDDYWGGAADRAYVWYDRLVSSLKQKNWESAVYEAGVLSHYYSDPIQPLHTAQSEAENNIHRAFEWSISKSYEDLKALGERLNPDIRVTHEDGYDWLERLVKKGATKANTHYDKLVAEYDFAKGTKKPEEGLNKESRVIISELIVYATVGFAGILDRAFAEASVIPPYVNLTVESILSSLQIPVRWVVNKLEDHSEKKLISRMYEELQSTGKVEKYLPEDDRLVRDLYKEEVLTPREPGSLAEALDNLKRVAGKMRAAEEASNKRETEVASNASDKKAVSTREEPESSNGALCANLNIDDPVERAPSIGPKTASRLEKVGIYTVRDLLQANIENLAAGLNVKYITPAVLNDWQDQARLVCDVPGLWGHDAQLIVGVGYRNCKMLSEAPFGEFFEKISVFSQSSKGKRILRSGKIPDEKEVRYWIAAAQDALRKIAA